MLSEQYEEAVFLPFQKSATIGKLMKALCLAQKDMDPIRKNKKNPDKGNKYVDLAGALEATDALNKHGITFMQFPDAQGAAVAVTTFLAFEEEWISSTLHLLSMKTVKGGGQEQWMDPQGVGSAITYARRYALMAILGLAAEDDDGEKASKQWQANKQEARAQQQEVAMARIEQEKAKVQAIQPPAQSEISRKIQMESDKFKRLAIFQEVKTQMVALPDGEKAYYDILQGVGVEHTNQFKSLVQACQAADQMDKWLRSAYAKKDAIAAIHEGDPI